jgi:hypothetical protein
MFPPANTLIDRNYRNARPVVTRSLLQAVWQSKESNSTVSELRDLIEGKYNV